MASQIHLLYFILSVVLISASTAIPIKSDATDLLNLGSSSVLLSTEGVYSESIIQREQKEFPWAGTWDFETRSGEITMSVELEKEGSGYKGWHCMVDGRIHGGAIDCYMSFGSKRIPSLTNSIVIDNETMEFDFESGYFPGSGKARLISVDDNTIRFIVTEKPQRFELSPLGNFLSLNEGMGEEAPKGIYLKKQ